METYAHSFFTWALAKHGLKAGRAAGVSGAVGAAFPDVPAFAAAAYYFDEFDSMPQEQLLNAIVTNAGTKNGTPKRSPVRVGCKFSLS